MSAFFSLENTADSKLFEQACTMVLGNHIRDNGIGTLGEKSIHAVLKYYFSPDADTHERSIGDNVADIIGEDGVMEIQTRQFRRLNTKLAQLLPLCPVTVIYPVISRKKILWFSPESGELLRTGPTRIYQKRESVFSELYQIRNYIAHPNFRLYVVELEAEDDRLTDGYGDGRRRRATRIDRIPTRLCSVYHFVKPQDYACFLPETLPPEFTTADYAKITKINQKIAQDTLRVLSLLGLIQIVRKEGRRNVFCVVI